MGLSSDNYREKWQSKCRYYSLIQSYRTWSLFHNIRKSKNNCKKSLGINDETLLYLFHFVGIMRKLSDYVLHSFSKSIIIIERQMYKKEGNRVENTVLGFIGAGNMATAIINGIVSTETMRPSQIAVFDVNEEKCAYFKQIGVQAASSASELASACSIIVLAVKPQNFEEVLTEIKEQVTEQKLMVSIAAGISTDYIRTTLGCQCPVIRTMPNTPLLLSQGATAMCRSQGVTDEMFETVEEFFSSCGTVSELEESQMNAVISVNGSSPAYFYLFAKAMLDNAEKQGIEKEVALPMIAQTFIGSAGMLVYSGKTPDELIEMVSSPGGTTLEALNVFYQHDLEKIVDEAMLACTKRAEELGK